MKKLFITLLFLPLLFVGNAIANEWVLAWHDEFNYTGTPDMSKWTYEVGLKRSSEDGIPYVGYFTTRLKNVRVEGGVLVLEAHKESYEGAGYTTGSITSRGKRDFKYGRIEIRAKMPYGSGSHTGLWLVGSNYSEVGWPACGEIDIAEYVGRLPHTIHLYNHYADPADKTKSAKAVVGKFTVSNPYNSFHLYAIEWDETQIKYFIDDKQVATFNVDTAGTGADNPFRKAQTLFLTYALGGWGWDVNSSVLPRQFQIDYVRVYTDPKSVAPANFLLLR